MPRRLLLALASGLVAALLTNASQIAGASNWVPRKLPVLGVTRTTTGVGTLGLKWAALGASWQYLVSSTVAGDGCAQTSKTSCVATITGGPTEQLTLVATSSSGQVVTSKIAAIVRTIAIVAGQSNAQG
jgi:hypothetical protein